MEDLGKRSSFLTLEPGQSVYAADGEEVGRIAEVRADEGTDIFDGIVVERGLLGGNRHFVPGDQVDEIFERGVVLAVDSRALEALPEEPN